jgi:hypothetical protein
MPPEPDARAEFDALQAVITALQPLDPEARARLVGAAVTFLQIGSAKQASRVGAPDVEHLESASRYPSFSTDLSRSPKDFLLDKQPRSDVERIAVLAYYLTYYRETPHFKTLDLSKLNTEAAQPKFSNAANSANNAVKQGYLVASSKGQRQLSAAGEQFVNALPDRDAARSAMAAARPRRASRRSRRVKKTVQG